MLHYHSHVPDSPIFVCLFKLHLFPDRDLLMWSRCYYLITIIIIIIIIIITIIITIIIIITIMMMMMMMMMMMIISFVYPQQYL